MERVEVIVPVVEREGLVFGIVRWVPRDMEQGDWGKEMEQEQEQEAG